MDSYYCPSIQSPEPEPSIESALATPERAKTLYGKLSALGFFIFAVYGVFSAVMDLIGVLQWISFSL